MEIIQVETPEQISTTREIFREYESSLKLNLCFQGFEQELAELPGKYAPPFGRLWLVYDEKNLIGCAALRKFDDDICEMKRLYVRPSVRGKGIGKRLVHLLINEARGIGYRKMRLDTYPSKMGQAVNIYHSIGFVEIDPYYDTPDKEILYMECDLMA